MANLIHSVIAEVNCSYSLTKGVNNSSVLDYKLSQLFHTPLRAKPIAAPLEVRWSFPPMGWVKANIDGSAFGQPSCGTFDVVFRDSTAQFLGGFSHNIGHASPFLAELCVAMFAIEKAGLMN